MRPTDASSLAFRLLMRKRRDPPMPYYMPMEERILPSVASKPSRETAALWSRAFRPFFLAASLWAALAVALWIALLIAGAHLPSRFDPLTWHIHAMLFGFVLAAIAGFMLTSIPIWTGRPPIHGAPLMGLAALWLIGRVACFISAFLPFWLAAALDLAFPVVLCGIAAREIIAARQSPASVGQPREERLDNILTLSADAALIAVSVRVHDKRFRDHLGLLRGADGWRIVSKTYVAA